MVDLHTHSDKSDGSLSPTELVDHAAELGLSAIALTDHDTTEGIDEAISRGFKKQVMVIPGVELSSEYQGQDVHIVGLCIDHHDYDFCKKLNEFVESRDNRNRKMCAKLTEAGMPVDYDELRATYTDSVGTPHLRLFPTWCESLQILVTFLLAVLGWIIFRAPGMPTLFHYLEGLCNTSLFSIPWLSTTTRS